MSFGGAFASTTAPGGVSSIQAPLSGGGAPQQVVGALSSLEQSLRAKVQESLDFCIYKNAIFLAERLHSEFPTNDSLHLLATCLQRSGDTQSAYRLLKQHRPFQFEGAEGMEPEKGAQWRCLYLFGVCCGTTDRYQDCEQAMEELSRSHDHFSVRYWLGVAGQHMQRRWAGKSFVSALNQNPSLFTAYESAVQYAGEIDVNPYRALLQHSGASPAPTSGPNQQQQQQQGLGVSSHNTVSTSSGQKPPSTSAGSSSGVRSRAGSHQQQPQQQTSQQRVPGGPTTTAARSGASPVPFNQTLPAPMGLEAGTAQLYSMLKPFADVARCLASHRCQEAINTVTKHLQGGGGGSDQGGSAWMLISLAMAYFHSGQHQQTVQVFAQVRTRFPWRLNDPALVYYSTALWHARDEHALAQLSQVMVEALPMSSISLAILGNCYSVVKEGKAALTMFSRACQADPSHAYAHNLRGYECLGTDQRQEAEIAFNMALRYDPAMYTAHAGLGTLYYQDGNDEKARHYYSQALKMNQLVTIYNCLARTLTREHASKQNLMEALGYYDAGLARSPKHFAARHQRAVLLLRLGKPEEAAQELEQLRDETPQEAATHIELGRAYSRLNQPANAVQALHKAMDLDPRRTAYVKELLERMSSSQDQKI